MHAWIRNPARLWMFTHMDAWTTCRECGTDIVLSYPLTHVGHKRGLSTIDAFSRTGNMDG